MRDKLVQRLEALTSTIAEICRVSGTPGVSIGVVHGDGDVVYTDNFGYRDVEAKKPPDEDTLYYIASLSKAFTAAAVGILVDRKQLEWKTPVSEILPDFKHKDKTIREKATMADFLSHRTGLETKNQMWWTEFGHLSLPREETVRFSSYLEPVYPFRKRWLYNNWGYGLADSVVERLSKQTWGAFLEKEIFQPLGLDHTTVHHQSTSQNVALGYMSLSDGTPFHVPRPTIEDGKLLQGAAAIQSSVRDLLKFYQNLMNAEEDQRLGRQSNSPLKNVPTLFQKHVDLEPEPSPLERSYGLGWVRTELPGSLGMVGLNVMYTKTMPVVGKGLKKPRLCLYHQGSIICFLSSVYLLPDTKTAIVVLTNSMARNDAADWIGELLLEAVLDNSEKNDYLSIATESAKESIDQWPRMARQLESKREQGTKPKPFDQYIGVYWNAIKNWRIDVLENPEDTSTLLMCFQGNKEQSYVLRHYHHDIFSWLLTRNEDVIRYGRFPITSAGFYLFRFDTDESTGKIQHLIWRHDPEVEDGETFTK